GRGANALKLAKQGWSVLGIDWAETAIKLATEAAEQSGLNARFIVHDAKNWISPLAFDLVIITYALPGAEDNRAMLQTAVSALASGGTLLVVEWDRSIAEKWGLSTSDFFSPASIVAMLPGMDVEKAEVKYVSDMFSGPDDPRWYGAPEAKLALVQVKKP
ncbi:MAG: class I SAM-dependent methyltransferase, partial [Okeania sp. SIO3B3]|nr:class I SAM-dependent methyltransferase [Okeania sp. SIO3B3]